MDKLNSWRVTAIAFVVAVALGVLVLVNVIGGHHHPVASFAASSSSPLPPSSTPTTPSTVAAPAPTATEGTTRCTVGVLHVSFGAKTVGAAQTTQVVDLTNDGTTPCATEGFPGVNLVGSVGSQQDYVWPLVRSSTRYGLVTLQPGDTAHFDLFYLPFANGDGTDMTVTGLVLTPPNTYDQTRLPWDEQVLLQDAATHPGTYIGPVTAGAS